MPDVDDLSDENQFKVFWLQEHLFEEGIEGIYFTDVMKQYLNDEAEDDIEQDVASELRKKNF